MKSSAKNSWRLKQSERLITATALSLIGLLSYLLSTSPIIFSYSLGDILLIAAALLSGLPIAKKALVALRYKIIGIDLLVSIAVVDEPA
jgi:Cd2+/Zn2+-exporting ATPase